MSRLYLVSLFAVLESSLLFGVLTLPLDGHDGKAHKLAPIFHEADHDDGAPLDNIVEDAREWVHEELKPSEIMDLFDPATYIDINIWLMEIYKNAYKDLFENKLPTSRDNYDMNDYLVAVARIRMNSALEPYIRDIPNRKKDKYELKPKSEQTGILVGSSWRPGESLGANINNYAPDNFSDDEIIRLFEMSDKVRQQLASDAVTNDGTLSLAEHKAINERTFDAYLEAMAGFKVLVEFQQFADDDNECRICLDRLDLEPALELPCKHRYHVECLNSWTKLRRAGFVCSRCVTCRMGYRIPYLSTKDPLEHLYRER